MEKFMLQKETAERMVFFAALLIAVGVLCTWTGISSDRFFYITCSIGFWLQTWAIWSQQEQKIWNLSKWVLPAALVSSVGMTGCLISFWRITR